MRRALLGLASLIALASSIWMFTRPSPWHCIEHSTETSLVEHGDDSVYTVHVFCTKYQRAQ